MQNQHTPRKQLQAFYARQGLTGKHARKAVAHDLRLARKEFNRTYQGGNWAGACEFGLAGLFVWRLSPQGSGYWIDRSARPL